MRNEPIWNRRVLFGMVLSFVVLTVPLALAAPSMYIDPQTKNLNCGESDTMEVRITTEASTQVAQAYIHFDPACVNITDVDFTGAPWQPLAPLGWMHKGDYVTTGTANFAGVAAGDHLFATITVECVCDGDSCTSDIRLDNLAPVYPTVNGTVTCEEPDDDDCLGMCYEGTVCEGTPIGKMNCSTCLAMAGTSWLNDPCPVSASGCTCPSMCWTECPECCDGIDNDPTPDGLVDWPADPKCGCCIDENETDGTVPCPPPCVPELPTLALAGIGILGIALLARKRD
jgi:hypothetical protein